MQGKAHFKKKLTDLKQDLMQRIAAIDRDIRHEDISADWADQASERENDQVLETLGSSSEQELSMINLALQRLESGTYFHCASCGEEIAPARLELLPSTSQCVHCAEQSER